MLAVGPDSDQVLEVMGTDAFENFVRELEKEGVHVQTEREAAEAADHDRPGPGAARVRHRDSSDRAVPRPPVHEDRGSRRRRPQGAVRALGDWTAATSIRLTAEAAAHGYTLGDIEITDPRVPLAGEVLASIVHRTQAKAGLTFEFATLAPLVEQYLRGRCFGEIVDLEDEQVRRFLRREDVRDAVASELAPALGRAHCRARAGGARAEADEARRDARRSSGVAST